MGSVETTSKALVQVMLGKSIESRVKNIERFVRPRGQAPQKVATKDKDPINRIGQIEDRKLSEPFGTPNQIYMGAAAGLHTDALKSISEEQLSKMMDREEKEGPRPWELLCFDPHEGMYLLARMGVIAHGGELGLRAAKLLAQELRIADLVVAPDGNCNGLPGTRPPVGINSSRRALSHVYIEVRRRQEKGKNLVHRGTGGRVRDIKWDEDSDALVEGPAWWLRQLLDAGHELQGVKLIDILVTSPLPKRLRLGLTVSRTSTGTLATLDDPGITNHKQYIITGSAASKRRADKREAPITWIKVDWSDSHKHKVTGGEAWQTFPPHNHRGIITRIEGAQ